MISFKQTTSIVLLFVLMIPLCIACYGDDVDETENKSNSLPSYFIPFTRESIEDDVNDTIDRTNGLIQEICDVPEDDRNETNTIIAFDSALSEMDTHLLKYQALLGLYPDDDLRTAAETAAQKRNDLIRTIAEDEYLYQCIKKTKPATTYGRWLYEQELTFFRLGGVGKTPEEKEELKHLHQELELLDGQYLENIRDNRPVSENLQILTKSAVIRSTIANRSGYDTWTNLVTESQGSGMMNFEINNFLNTTTPQVQEVVKPMMAELLTLKQETYPDASRVYDFEIGQLIKKHGEPALSGEDRTHSIPAELLFTRTLATISCLLGVKTEKIQEAVTYAPDVTLYQVFLPGTDQTIGWFYLDLSDRPGKSSQWLTVLIHTGWKSEAAADPVFILSGTLRNTSAGPEFGDEELTLFFHELGHLYTRMLAGTSTSDIPAVLPVELTETQSRFFELLPWTPEFHSLLFNPEGGTSVRKISRNGYSPPSAHDPKSYEYQWFLARDTIIAALDFKIAGASDNVRFGEWYTDIYTNTTGIPPSDQGGYLLTHPHFSGSTAGTYWIYPAGDMFARDIYQRFQEEGFLNKTTWNDFISKVIRPENQDMTAEERIRNFSKERGEIENIRDSQIENSPVYKWRYVPRCIL